MSKKKKHKKKRDPVATFVGIWNTITWVAMFAGLMFINYAKPEKQTIFDNKYGKTARTIWLMDYVELGFNILLFSIAFSIVGLFIHGALIAGEKKKHVSYGLLFAAIICIFASIITYFELLR